MCNDCWNNYTIISCDQEQLTKMFEDEFMSKVKANGGDDWFLDIKHRGPCGIQLEIYSKWVADVEFFKSLVNKYPKCWFKNEWYTEDVQAGVLVGGYLHGEKQPIQIFDWTGPSLEDRGYLLSNNHPPFDFNSLAEKN